MVIGNVPVFGDDYCTISPPNADFDQRDDVAALAREAEILELCEVERTRDVGKQRDVSRLIEMAAPRKIIRHEQLEIRRQLVGKRSDGPPRAPIIERADDCL
jgi:hypothetical protein